GAPLAYAAYPAPFLRPRGDTDVLVRPVNQDAARAVLLRLGYTEHAALSTQHVSQQAQYSRVLRTGVEHTIDLHWRTFNPAAFAECLTFDEMWMARTSVPPLGH